MVRGNGAVLYLMFDVFDDAGAGPYGVTCSGFWFLLVLRVSIQKLVIMLASQDCRKNTRDEHISTNKSSPRWGM